MLRRITFCELEISAKTTTQQVCGDISTLFQINFKVTYSSEYIFSYSYIQIACSQPEILGGNYVISPQNFGLRAGYIQITNLSLRMVCDHLQSQEILVVMLQRNNYVLLRLDLRL